MKKNPETQKTMDSNDPLPPAASSSTSLASPTPPISLNEDWSELLDDLQPGIVKHHGRAFANHLFLYFTNDAAAKSWISKQLADRIITAKQQLMDVQAYHLDPAFKSRPVVVAALSAAGYLALQVANEKVPSKTDTAFWEGMKSRGATLHDSQTGAWDVGFRGEIHCLVIIADVKEEMVEKITRQITMEIASFGSVVHLQKGKVLRNEKKIGIEHFGYADGVSQPLFLKEEIEAQNTQLWNDKTDPLESLLVKEPGSENGKGYGSFLVFRKLEQNVAGFKEAETDLSKTFNGGAGIKDRNGEPNKELAGAMLVGRFEDGTATIMDSDETGIAHEEQLNNDFDYTRASAGAAKCPFHAHIRITNSRDEAARKMRITRRGIPYNDIGRDEEDLEGDQPTSGVGLLFMCYQKDIASQFEAMQKKANNEFDAIIGQPATATNPNILPSQWGNTDASKMKPVSGFPGFVTLKGGEYFFTPSISFLKSL